MRYTVVLLAKVGTAIVCPCPALKFLLARRYPQLERRKRNTRSTRGARSLVPLVLLVFLSPTPRMITDVDQVYVYALKLLKGRDYSVDGLRQKLATKFGSAPENVIQQLLQKNFLNDRRFAE